VIILTHQLTSTKNWLQLRVSAAVCCLIIQTHIVRLLRAYQQPYHRPAYDLGQLGQQLDARDVGREGKERERSESGNGEREKEREKEKERNLEDGEKNPEERNVREERVNVERRGGKAKEKGESAKGKGESTKREEEKSLADDAESSENGRNLDYVCDLYQSLT